MFVNILFFIFLSAFIAIAALGHAMLFAAIWPGLFAKERGMRRQVEQAEREPAAAAGQHVHQPN